MKTVTASIPVIRFEILNTILVLRDLDMPLKEIQTYLSQRSPELFQQIFLERESQITQQIKKLQTMKKWMQQQRKKIKIAEQTDFSTIEINTYPQYYYLYKEADPSSTQSFSKKLNELITLLQRIIPIWITILLIFNMEKCRGTAFTMPTTTLHCSCIRNPRSKTARYFLPENI
ncbi:MAG: MerR family DNA-binding protein [Dorea sp.]